MDELNPIYRIEFFLDAIVNNTTPPEPIYRVEFYLAKIAGADVEIPEPVHRMEFYLAYLCGENVELPTPVYRVEYYLAFLCGLNVELPEPIYRIEFWLWDWCGGGGIEKTVIGNPIHITDALAKPVQALSIALEPIQDLHGYDNPWPSGGGVNLLPPNATDGTQTVNGITCVAENGVYKLSGTASEGTEFIFQLTESVDLSPSTNKICFLNSQANSNIAVYFMRGTSSIHFWGMTPANRVGSGWTDTGNEVIDNIRITVANGAVIDGTITISPVLMDKTKSDATAFSPYSNICPISGHTDADVWDDPKYGGFIEWNQNTIDGNFTDSTKWASNDTTHAVFSMSDNVATITALGTIESFYQMAIVSTNLVTVTVDHKYYLTLTAKASKQMQMRYRIANGGAFNSVAIDMDTEWSKYSEIITATVTQTNKQTFNARETTDVESGVWFSVKNAMLIDLTEMFGAGNEPSTVAEIEALFPKDYYAYNSGTQTTVSAVNGDPYRHYPIPLGQTVYGGTLDVVTGVLTVTHVASVFDGTENWRVERQLGTNSYYIARPSNVKLISELSSSDILCSACKVYIGAWYLNTMRVTAGYYNFVFGDLYSTVEDFKTFVANNQLTVVEPLATPQTIQLTPTQVELLQGENNIWSDGTMTLVYLADGNASDVEALNILLGGRYVNNHEADEPTDREALDILLGR